MVHQYVFLSGRISTPSIINSIRVIIQGMGHLTPPRLGSQWPVPEKLEKPPVRCIYQSVLWSSQHDIHMRSPERSTCHHVKMAESCEDAKYLVRLRYSSAEKESSITFIKGWDGSCSRGIIFVSSCIVIDPRPLFLPR